MRRLPALIFLSFASVAFSTPVTACLNKSVTALVAAVDNQRVNRTSLRGCRPPNLNQPPPGSGNWPILASAALYLDGAEDSHWLLPWLSGAEGRWGHNGREGGSTIYEALNWASALAVRHHACHRANDGELCAAAGAWLKAGWAKWALAATTSAPSRIEFRQANQVAERSRLGMIGYFGPFAHLAGDRQAEDPNRGQFMGSWVELTAVHPLLAWAADMPGRRYKESEILPAERSLPLWVAKRLTGKSYSQTLPLDLVGLTAEERQTLQDFLTRPTDKDLAAQLVAWLATYPSNSRTVTYRRYASGNIVVVASHTTNANKSGATVTAGIGAKSIWLLPSRFAGVGAASAQGQLLENRAIATSNDGGRLELDLANLGPVAWEAVWDLEGARLEGVEPGPACTLAQLGGLAETIACLQEEPATPGEVVPLLAPLDSILALLTSYESLNEEERQEALNRIEAEAEAIAAEIRRQRGDAETSPPP